MFPSAYAKFENSRASVMARSLFALSPHWMPKPAIIPDIFLAKEAAKSCEKGCIEAHFNDLQKTFTSPHRNHSINIGLL